MINAKTGFDKDQQLVINLNSAQSQKNSDVLIKQMNGNANFKTITRATAPLISGDMNLYASGRSISDKQIVFMDFADENYLKTLGLQLISGSNISPVTFTNTNMQEDMELHDFGKEIILNEEATKLLSLDPYTAAGKYVSHLHNGIVYNYKIVGVVKNYHYFSLHASIGPCGIMACNPLRCTSIVAKVNGHQAASAVQFVSDQWKKFNPDTPFSYGFLDAIFQSDYSRDQSTQKMTGIFATMAIFISCLGLLGLITYSLTRKAREIGIRKVLGASVSNIVVLFYKQYFRLVLVANLIALPLGWYFMRNWLSDFPYKVSISWWVFAISLLSGLIVAFLTISFKTIRAATINPVESLRNE